jgi:hypothetical protein
VSLNKEGIVYTFWLDIQQKANLFAKHDFFAQMSPNEPQQRPSLKLEALLPVLGEAALLDFRGNLDGLRAQGI